MSRCEMCRVYADEEGDAICVEAGQNVDAILNALDFMNDEYDAICVEAGENVDEIESALDFIDEYDNHQAYTQRWRVSGYEDNFDVVDLDTESDQEETQDSSEKCLENVMDSNEKSSIEDKLDKVMARVPSEVGSQEVMARVPSEIGSQETEVISISSSSEIEFFPCSNNKWIEPEKEKSNTSSKEKKNSVAETEKIIGSSREKEETDSNSSSPKEQKRKLSPGM